MFGLFKNMFSENSAEELSTLIKNGAVLVDVRTPQEYSEGNVPKSLNIPLGELQQNLKKLNPQQDIIVFCRSGNRSSQAKSILEKNGFTKVVNGGTWQNVKSAQKASENLK